MRINLDLKIQMIGAPFSFGIIPSDISNTKVLTQQRLRNVNVRIHLSAVINIPTN